MKIENSKKKCADKKIEELNKSKGLNEYWIVINKMKGKKKEGINEEISDELWLMHFMNSLVGCGERRRCDLEKVDAPAEMNLKTTELKRGYEQAW